MNDKNLKNRIDYQVLSWFKTRESKGLETINKWFLMTIMFREVGFEPPKHSCAISNNNWLSLANPKTWRNTDCTKWMNFTSVTECIDYFVDKCLVHHPRLYTAVKGNDELEFVSAFGQSSFDKPFGPPNKITMHMRSLSATLLWIAEIGVLLFERADNIVNPVESDRMSLPGLQAQFVNTYVTRLEASKLMDGIYINKSSDSDKSDLIPSGIGSDRIGSSTPLQPKTSNKNTNIVTKPEWSHQYFLDYKNITVREAGEKRYDGMFWVACPVGNVMGTLEMPNEANACHNHAVMKKYIAETIYEMRKRTKMTGRLEMIYNDGTCEISGAYTNDPDSYSVVHIRQLLRNNPGKILFCFFPSTGSRYCELLFVDSGWARTGNESGMMKVKMLNLNQNGEIEWGSKKPIPGVSCVVSPNEDNKEPVKQETTVVKDKPPIVGNIASESTTVNEIKDIINRNSDDDKLYNDFVINLGYLLVHRMNTDSYYKNQVSTRKQELIRQQILSWKEYHRRYGLTATLSRLKGKFSRNGLKWNSDVKSDSDYMTRGKGDIYRYAIPLAADDVVRLYDIFSRVISLPDVSNRNADDQVERMLSMYGFRRSENGLVSTIIPISDLDNFFYNFLNIQETIAKYI